MNTVRQFIAIICLITTASAGAQVQANITRNRAAAPPKTSFNEDKKGEEILRTAFRKMGECKSLSLNISVTMSNTQNPEPATFKGSVIAMKPNLLKVELTGPVKLLFNSDGKTYYQIQGDGAIRKSKVSANPIEFIGVWEGEIDSFFGGETSVDRVMPSFVGSTRINRIDCDVVKVEMKSPDRTVTYSIGKKDSIIYKAVLRFGGQTQSNLVSEIKYDPELKESDFTYTPPKEAKQRDEPTEDELFKELESDLLAVGKTAPAFEIPTPSGGKVSLAGALAGKKALLLNFWFYNCRPCREEHPKLQEMYDQLKAKGLELIAVNSVDPRQIVNKYLRETNYNFKVGLSSDGTKEHGIPELYGVKAFPTNYVISPEGKVVYAGVSFRPDKIRAALESLGVK